MALTSYFTGPADLDAVASADEPDFVQPPPISSRDRWRLYKIRIMRKLIREIAGSPLALLPGEVLSLPLIPSGADSLGFPMALTSYFTGPADLDAVASADEPLDRGGNRPDHAPQGLDAENAAGG